MLAWDLVVEPLGWDEYISWDGLQRAWDALPTLFMSDKLKDKRSAVAETAGFGGLPGKARAAAVDLEADYYAARDKGNLPTDEYFDGVSEAKTELESEIAKLEALIAKLSGGAMAEALIGPRQAELNQLKADLAWFVEEEANAHARAAKIKASMSALSGDGLAVELNADSIDAALADVRAKASTAAMSTALDELSSLSRLIKTNSVTPEQSIRSIARPESSPRPPQRPVDYQAPQPNVTVESSFESHPKISVAVTVPVHITREQKVDNRAIARATGLEAERATRRALDDAAIAEE